MIPLSLLSRVDVGEVTEAWTDGLLSLPSTPAGGGSVDEGEGLLLSKLEEGEILCGGRGGRNQIQKQHGGIVFESFLQLLEN